MSVETTTRSVDYTSDGSTLAYAVNFPFLETEHLVVQQITPADVTTTLAETTHYSVSGTRDGSGYSSGTVTLVTALTTGYTLRIRRVLPIKQLLDFRGQGSFTPGMHEYGLDYVTMILQQLNDGEISVDSYVAGETNTASNVNVAGVGVYKQKTGVNFEFRGINAGSAKITVTNDAANNEIDIDLGSVAIANLSDGARVTTAETDITNLEANQPFHGDYTWNAGTSVWDATNLSTGTGTNRLPTGAGAGTRTAAGKCKLTFTSAFSDVKEYGVSVTYLTTSGSSGYAPRIIKNVAYVEVWLYEGAALADDVDFHIVITPKLS